MLARALSLLVTVALAATTLPLPASAASASTTVLFVGGYGSNLATVGIAFAPLRATLLAADPSTRFAQYSYSGWNAQACAPNNYFGEDTGQDFEKSKRLLLETIYLLRTHCGATRIVVIGHSLGGLVALHALSDNPMSEVTNIVTIDSPLGGAPAAEVDLCVQAGLCADGPVSAVLADLYANWDATALANAQRVRTLAAAGIRTTAWGNESDCLYAPARCVPAVSYLLGTTDATDSQWLGIDRALRRDFVPPHTTLASVVDSHQVVMSAAARDIASDLLA